MYLCWFVTCKCNLSCSYCFAIKNYQEVPFHIALSIGEALASSNAKIVVLTGGEPFVLPYLLDLIDMLYSKLSISITSNAQLIPSQFLEDYKEKISYLTISLNTMEEKIARFMHGSNYNLEKVLSIAQEALQNNISIKINTLVSRINVGEVSKVGKFIRSLPLNKTNIIWKLIKFHNNPYVVKDLSNLQITKEQFSDLFIRLKKNYLDLNIVPIDNNTIDRSYILITPNGDVILPNNQYKSVGNVIQTPLQHLINNNLYRYNNRLLEPLSRIIKRRE